MSTSIDTIRVEADSQDPSEGAAGVVDVTGLSLSDVEDFVGDGEGIHLERQNGRTYVVADR
jgi:hypothetical protein